MTKLKLTNKAKQYTHFIRSAKLDMKRIQEDINFTKERREKVESRYKEVVSELELEKNRAVTLMNICGNKYKKELELVDKLKREVEITEARIQKLQNNKKNKRSNSKVDSEISKDIQSRQDENESKKGEASQPAQKIKVKKGGKKKGKKKK